MHRIVKDVLLSSLSSIARCGGIFCNGCSHHRMVLRGQGDSPVRICEPCKKLEEAARFELRYGQKNKAGKGGSRATPIHEDEVLNQILGNDKKELSPAYSKNEANSVEETLLDDSLSDASIESPEKLREQAVEEKKKYKILKGEGKSEEALKAFKRGKELERQATAVELSIRKNRRRPSSSNTTEIEKSKSNVQKGKEKDDLASELRDLGWSDMDLHDADKKPANMSLEGELSTLLREVSHKATTKTGASSSIDKTQVIALKKKALTLKREGKLTEAKEELKKAKILEQQLEEQALLEGAEDSDDELSALIRGMDDDDDGGDDTRDYFSMGFKGDHLDGIDNDLGDDSHFDVTNEDMNDPEMAAALKSFGWTEETDCLEETDNREAILSEIQALKRQAVAQKRAGNTAEAVSLHKKSKLLESNLDVEGPPDSILYEEKTASKPNKGKSRSVIQKELLGLKKQALALRREGKLDEADEVLKRGKVLEQQLEEIDNHASEVKPARDNNNSENLVVMDGGEEVTDQDMFDPTYLSLLSNLGWKEEEAESSRHNGDTIVTQAAVSSRKSKGEIQRELLGLKRKALALKRQGQTEEADEVLNEAKVLEAQLAEMESAKPKIPAEIKNDMLDSLSVSQPVNVESKVEVKAAIISDQSEQIPNDDSIRQEILAHKRKALALKREGRLPEAKEELRQAKLLEKRLEDILPAQLSIPAQLDAEKATPAVTPIVEKEPSPLKPASKPALSSRDRFKLQQQSLGHKRQALKFRREGRTEEADAEFELAKALESQLEELSAQDSSKSSLDHVDDGVGVEDFLDPQLLLALKSIGLNNEASVSSQVPNKKMEAPVIERGEDSSSGKERKIQQLEEEIKAEKIKAVKLKRSGNQQGALEALRRAKMLEKKLNS
ncbi:microtubule-associated protein futsch isoform X2 [Impatiens glandulifera]|uniref:microtubule-associated protein futsch isoform X2 n=1 Tax=Impatiens glandulifera TaxID=253017 RepID=UPI001FB0B0BC|nr:microtubule-associated protein futsch isoform X2 [Impatiens glandulifera]XP_047310185.1 microtubule-associated protein futsch isoform X2 [Impatiens glandulifera]XP_047310186.1 microtubule-associated protein futsch isoform X2 [Impatiens glandulifera]